MKKLKNIFKKKTQKEKEISKLEHELYKCQKKLEFLSPRIQKRLFRDDKVEVVSTSRIETIVEYERKIEHIKQKLIEIKK